MIRRLQVALIATVLIVAAFSTGADFLFFLVYLGILVIGGAYLVTRFGLADLEAGYVLDRPHAQVGDTLRATYTVRNTSRIPKLWLEVYNPTSLPVALPGRALALGSRSERSWVARVPLTRRGHFRVDPMVIRTGDPFGLFESYASVGSASTVIVYPPVESLPHWRLPSATLEGTHASPERTLQTTAMVSSIRPYVPGDAYNRIHWKSSARHQELQVKEFDLEQTADVWLFVDLDRSVHAGIGDTATIETAVRVAASIGSRALIDNRSLGFTATGLRRAVLPADRGPRQQQKLLQLLAAIDADGAVPLRELLVEGLSRLRRGMTAVVITPSLERDWIRPLATLRVRGIGTAVCVIDPVAHEDRTRLDQGKPPLPDDEREARAREARALKYALAEHDLQVHVLAPRRSLGEQIVSMSPGKAGVRV
ncbi:MAG TPA: DUF58 domain-containing protein [Candidatus Limnocylindrales bacterium]|nr:DUF58 domain-containing protein [Candidatus Limnocylindrales bacterium]